jgi:opacity protein-like surface antigen
MSKKLFLTLFVFPYIAFANPTPFSGWYTSLGGGLVNYNLNLQQNLGAIPEGSPPLITTTINTNNYSNNIYGSFALGYDFHIKPQFVLGTELKSDLASSSISKPLSLMLNIFNLLEVATDSNIEYTNKYNFSLLLKPGYLPNNTTMLYAVIGGGMSRLKYSSSISGQAVPGNLVNSTNVSATNNSPTLTLGFGVDKYLTNNFSLGLEYNYLQYFNVPKLNQFQAFPSDGVDLFDNLQKVTLYRNTLELKLTYHF